MPLATIIRLAVLTAVLIAGPFFAGTGIKAKKPVFGGACRLCPWGAMADVVQAGIPAKVNAGSEGKPNGIPG